VIEYSDAALKNDACDVQAMADKEGLTAHRASVDIRIK
jgi:histidinol dehydrogenase